MNTAKKTSGRTLFTLMLLAVLLIGTLLPAQAAPSAAPSGQRLRNLAGSLLIGYEAMSNFRTISDTAQFQEVARSEFNIVTPENAMKWDATEPSQNNFNFGQADELVSFAQANGQKVHGHTLVWHSQLPSWVANSNWNSTSLTNVMYNHIDKVMNHWADGQIHVWDVVNEAFNEDGSRRSSVFQRVIGNSFIELAFRRARAADPLTKLIYNDYNVETVNAKSNAMYNMVADFKNRGVPIDGVGLQMHLAGGIDYNSLAQNMQRFANLGVEVYITEMDVRYPTPISSTNLQAQATVYQSVLDVCLKQPACKAFQIWGITDRHSWVPSTFPGTGDALIFDYNYNPKPAYYALQTRLGGTQPQPTTPPQPGNLLTNGNAESGTTGWSVFGAGSLSSDTSQFHGGSRSIKISGRTASWNGIGQSVTSKLTNGKSYTTNVWVRTQSGTPNAKVTLALTANGTTSYITLAPDRAVNASGWTLLSGSATVSWSGTLSGATLYVETAAGTDNFYIDDASFQ